MEKELEVNGAVTTSLSLALAELRDGYSSYRVETSFSNGDRLVVPGDPQGRRYLRGLAQLTVLTQTAEEE